jgi:predicted transposase/invertase (TIGR01784 family)
MQEVYYLSKTYADQLGVGEDYAGLNTVIGIHFLDFRYFADDRVLRQFVFKDAETNDAPAQLDCVRLYFIEMPKFDKDWADIKTSFDRWVAFFNRGEAVDQDAVPEALASDPAVSRALAELERAGLSEVERDIYEGEVKKKMIDAVQIRSAEERGEQKSLRRTLLRQMTRRLGGVPSDVAAKLQSLSADVLDDLDLSLPDLHTYVDVEQWLARN